MIHAKRLILTSCLFVLLLVLPLVQAADLPSWHDGASRKAITDFVVAVTTEGSKDYVPTSERIAVFDNDGTLWSEQPMYFQVLFAFSELKRMAPQHPEWKTQQPFKAALEGDEKTLHDSGMDGLMKIVAVTHTGMSSAQFLQNAQHWLATARHPKTQKPFTGMVFQPMLELLAYLRANGFRTYIVSGGEVTFMRAFAEQVYGIPPEQVIGTTFATEFRDQDGQPVIQRLPKLVHNDDGPGKPVSIESVIGRRPIFAFGNSDGDLQMLQWTSAGKGRHFAGLVHHTDAKREWAYDRSSSVGRLDKALDEAKTNDWTVVDMAGEWNKVYPFESAAAQP